MKPRNLAAILTLPKQQRLGVIAEGLQLLAEHVGTLRDDLTHLQEAQRSRGAAVIDGLASEEAAKILILMDVARMGWDDDSAVARQIKSIISHRVRGIYGRVIEGRPASFGEVRRYADSLRRSHYLDGPNDVDWIFRNVVEAEREESLYVDYVTSEGVSSWITPASGSELRLELWPSMVIDLALALHRLGCTSEAGLTIIADEWKDVSLEDSTHWSVVEEINTAIFDKLNAAGLCSDDLTASDVRLAREHWIFPLGSLELSEIKVTQADLQAQREQWLADQ
ncbi:hypothetical protein [Streptomyces luteogriseus]|uniref:hypothetical protein n=1 Tax=Streptomyces luteogriseus TaxID=68233 RepID=UPI0036CBF64E